MGRKQSQLEARFRFILRTLGDIPAPVEEYQFHAERKWRFDFAWPEQLVAVEIDGGQWVIHGGRHNRDSDRWKLNQAAALGWRVLRYSGRMMDEPARVVEEITTALAIGGRG